MANTRRDHQKRALAQTRLTINNLPNEVITTILMKLPTRDVVRTSVLSRKWRYRWAVIPQFLFDQTLWDTLVVKHSAVMTFTTIMYHFMSNHKGPILRFILSIPELESCPEIDNLINFLSRNYIVDLTIDMWYDMYTLPSSIFRCEELMHLNLTECKISTPPLVFKGFGKLTTLKLLRCSISTAELRSLLSGSPMLELVELDLYSRVDLYIDGPNLRKFSFFSATDSIFIKRAPFLASFSMKPLISSGRCNFTKLFQGLTAVESLCLNYCMIKNSVFTDGKDPITLVHLKHVNLESVSFNDVLVPCFIFKLFRRSPNLKSIEIQFEDDMSFQSKATTIYLEGDYYSDIWLSKLKEVKLSNISRTKPEMEFVKLLLAKSPTLREILITPMSFHDGYLILREVIQFQRISKEAQVFLLDPRGLPSN